MAANSPRKIKCPTCGKAVRWEGNPFRPFCSERCRMIDLGAWVDEEYRIPAEEKPDYGEPEDE
jgi:endogenous inhibitor of DNA gyrase (YacG/DUF329 family)